MPPSPDTKMGEPLLEIIDGLATAPLHAAAWATCAGPGWFFGHASNDEASGRFWQMDLRGDGAFDAIWELARPRCEALAGTRLRVIRQYANGHTYGLGGAAHTDDERGGTFTLLYYPNPEWRDDWEGETVYYDPDGEVALAVRPRPNRAVLFDSRIPHAGRAPSRSFNGLRVTVAYKLELVGGIAVADRGAELPSRVAVSAAEPASAAPMLEVPMVEEREDSGDVSAEVLREGATRTMLVRVLPETIAAEVAQRLAALSRTVRLPGYPPGQIPAKVMEERYGARARIDAMRRIAATMIDGTLLPAGTVPATFSLADGPDGSAHLQITATHVPDLAWEDMATWQFDRVSAPAGALDAAKLRGDAAETLLRERLTQDVLDRLDAAVPFPVLPSLVERELATMRKLVAAHGQDLGGAGGEALEAQLRPIAERRFRLGVIILELARRFGIQVASGPQVEGEVVGRILALAQVRDRVATATELAALEP